MKLDLSQAELKRLLSYDPLTGEFTWLVQQGSKKPGESAGHATYRDYLSIQVKGCLFSAHRLAWLYMYGAFPDGLIDHIDHNRANNRIANLRCVAPAVNAQNQIKRKRRDPSIPLGVDPLPSGRYSASIRREYKRIRLGTFATKEEAAAAYLAAKREIHHESPDAAIYTISADAQFR